MSRVKVKKIKSDVDTGEINHLFSQMTGASSADPEIILPKFIKIKSKIIHILKILNHFYKFEPFWNQFTEFSDSKVEIKNFINEISESTGILMDNKEDYDKLKDLSVEQINSIYKRLKDNKDIKKLIIICSKLKRHKFYLDDTKKLSDVFIKREIGLSYTPLTGICNLDFKVIWISDNLTDVIKTYLLTILHHIYKDTISIYDVIMSPDVDIKSLSGALVGAITKIKKQIPRCNRAFKTIENSVNMLEDNFNKYWIDSVESENPNVILTNFITDVSMNQKADADLTRQFKKIIMYLKKASSNRQNDPRIKSLFKILGKNFKLMEENTPDYKKDDSDELNEDTEITQEDLDNLKNIPNTNTSDTNTSDNSDNSDVEIYNPNNLKQKKKKK